jgi:hypothetical protein
MLSAHRQKSLKASGKIFYKIHMHSDTQRDVEITYAIYIHGAGRTFCRKTLCRKTLCRKTFCLKTFCRTDVLPNGRFAERTFCRTDSLTNGQLAAKIEISSELWRFAYTIRVSVHIWLKSLSILMTETLIVKYSFVLYSFKFLKSLPKFRDIKNNNIQHHSWMRFPQELWMTVFHDSRSETDSLTSFSLYALVCLRPDVKTRS